MSGARPFRDVKLQWLQQLSCDRDLSDSARSVALYIVTTHLNGHTEKAWPSYQTIADATGKSVKTIQRAVRELEVKGWFEVQRGNGVGRNTEYRPSAASTLRASEAREKTDKIVTLYPNEGGQIRPARRSNMSSEGGQICPPNLEKEKINKSNPREGEPPRVETSRAVPLVFVAETKAGQIEQWRGWLIDQGMPALEKLGLRAMKCGKYGYTLPGHWPPDRSNPSALEWITFFRQRLDHIAKGGTRQTEVRMAS
ncbi:helix-turn-helix domain-containing protein [Rhizobium herbae]|uniref:DNA-binding transcriptional regulator YhcF (GntR family) n=1 Tax=Rhizobium herbae TaxID=508661 RepID=A0ABS4EUW9_9HYPH|nr:helix-turn-helix domain-containing protein [Rhizobium herbae]MBP1861761.1 DNA-binding transcriptional regulator YhcF (GntR family) [Rhizobium herbae]